MVLEPLTATPSQVKAALVAEVQRKIGECKKREQEVPPEHTKKKNLEKRAQSLEDEQTQRTKHQEKKGNFVEQAQKEIEENRKTIEEVERQNREEARVWQDLECEIKEMQSMSESRRISEASYFSQATRHLNGFCLGGCPDPECFFANFHTWEASAQEQ